ncbi:hypothetical protein BYT27DRAFT_7216923 [Phlegmacium glaucopus]|nr:hypothetical protein BYT27DRAFT_7216923 [Phlegmacium glaucopus]
MSRTTLDIIELASFNYNVNALPVAPRKCPYEVVFNDIQGGSETDYYPNTQNDASALRFLHSKASHEDDKRNKSSGRQDILSLSLQANAMEDLPEAQRMKDENILRNKKDQTNFRQDVSTMVSTDNPTIDNPNGPPH